MTSPSSRSPNAPFASWHGTIARHVAPGLYPARVPVAQSRSAESPSGISTAWLARQRCGAAPPQAGDQARGARKPLGALGKTPPPVRLGRGEQPIANLDIVEPLERFVLPTRIEVVERATEVQGDGIGNGPRRARRMTSRRPSPSGRWA